MPSLLEPRTEIVVMDEISIGYVDPRRPSFWPLASGIGGPDWKNGSVPLGDTRIAAQADFDRFRLCSRGFLP